jgi:hypothetical protein
MEQNSENAEKLQNKIEETAKKSKKYESRYKHGGPMRTVKKKKD